MSLKGNKIIIIDPRIQNLKELDYISKNTKNILICTLCSKIQYLFFKDKGSEVFDIGDSLLPIEKRKYYIRVIGESETLAYLPDTEINPSFPYNPVIISGGTNNILYHFIIQLISLLKYAHSSGIYRIDIFGSKSFYNTSKTITQFYSLDFRIIYKSKLKQSSYAINKEILKNEVITTLKDVLLFLKSVFSGKVLYFFNNSKNVRYYLSLIKKDYTIFPARPRWFFGKEFLNKKKYTCLENTARKINDNLINYFDDAILKDAVLINDILSVKPVYSIIVNTVNFYQIFKLLKKKIVYISELNHGHSNLFLKLFKDHETVYVQHAIIPGTYRLGIHYIEAQKVFFYSKFSHGPLSPTLVYNQNITYISYINTPRKIMPKRIKEKKAILFAPTTENYILADFEYLFIVNICKKIATFCIDKELEFLVKLHHKTPYISAINETLKAIQGVNLPISNNFSEVISNCDLLISSVNSNTITEGFFHKIPVIIFDSLYRPDYLHEYESAFCKVTSIDQLISAINDLTYDELKRNNIIEIQNKFIEKFIKTSFLN